MRLPDWLISMSVTIGVASVAWPKAQSPLFVWNISESVPVGLYVILARRPSRGEIAALHLTEPLRSLADERSYLPASGLLLKPVATRAGDIVCRSGAAITINGQLAAHALIADMMGRPMPKWSGCHDIDDRQVFVLSDTQQSFDGRYFGPVDAQQVIGSAVALWTVWQLPECKAVDKR